MTWRNMWISFLEELGEYDEDEFACLRDKVYARVEALPERTKKYLKPWC